MTRRDAVTIGGRRKVKFGDAKEDVVSDENEDDDDDDDNDSEEEDDASDDNDAEEEEESDDEDGGSESDEGDSSDSEGDAPKLKLKAIKRKIGENVGKAGEKVKKTRVALETVESRLELPAPPPAKKPRSEMSLKELNRDMLREMGDSGRDQSVQSDESITDYFIIRVLKYRAFQSSFIFLYFSR